MKPLVLLGAGGFALEACEWVWGSGGSVKAFFDQTKEGTVNGLPVLSVIGAFGKELDFLPAVGDLKLRNELIRIAMFESEMCPCPPVIHPSAVVSRSATLSHGTIVCPQVAVCPNVRIGSFALLNLGCTIGHETEIGLNCNIAPGANISGRVKIGDHVYIGSNAFVRENIQIGKNATIGAGAVVVKDVPEGATVVGNPARPLKG